MSGIANFRYRHDRSGDPSNVNAEVRDELHRSTGAIVIGRTMFDVGEEPWGANPPFAMPVFIVTHRPRPTVARQGGTSYTFVSDGIVNALEQARGAAGDRHVLVVGSAISPGNTSRPGCWTKSRSHLVPVLLGAGVRLCEGTGQVTLEPTRTIESSDVTHLSDRVMH